MRRRRRPSTRGRPADDRDRQQRPQPALDRPPRGGDPRVLPSRAADRPQRVADPDRPAQIRRPEGRPAADDRPRTTRGGGGAGGDGLARPPPAGADAALCPLARRTGDADGQDLRRLYRARLRLRRCQRLSPRRDCCPTPTAPSSPSTRRRSIGITTCRRSTCRRCGGWPAGIERGRSAILRK